MKSLVAALVVPVVFSAPAEAFPIVGGSGLCPNAVNLAAYIQDTYPAVTSIGGVRADRLPDHPSGHALDIMVPNLGLGDVINADIQGKAAQFGVRYTLWRVPNHFSHVHVTVA